MWEDRDEISNWLSPSNDSGMNYYVCGDAVVADAVYEMLVKVLRAKAKISRAVAVHHLSKMIADKRYHLDVWGVVHHFLKSRNEMCRKKLKLAAEWLRLTKEDPDEE